MNCFPPTSRFVMSTLHQVQRRSGNSIRGVSERVPIENVLFLSDATLSTECG